MDNINLYHSKLNGGFFGERLNINAETTIKSVYKRFKETGRFAALKCKKQQNPTHIFWDSDVAKWLEAVAYLLNRVEDKEIRFWYDEAVNDIVENQLSCGYFNSYFQVYEPENIFKRRTDHELYCAGHLFEAAVASSEYLHDDRLLHFSKKYVDYIYDRFVVKKDTGFTTPGHEEIELALIRLYKLTNEKKYKDLAMFFINERGTHDESEYALNAHEYSQSHLPVREQFTAEGHAVRALYLYIAMADMAKIENDKELQIAVEKLFDDIVNKKMYITGGVGGSHFGERFSCDYDLPNFMAYSETCGAIALALFCDRMLRLTGEAKYGHVFERVLYNGLLSGISLSGDAFFYVNPLEMRQDKVDYNSKLHGWQEPLPIKERIHVFDCSCCPPNICRFMEELAGFIWYTDEEKREITLSQHISSLLICDLADIELTSDFPYGGKIKLKINSHGKNLKLKVRIPEWCEKKFNNAQNGYLIFEKVFDDEILEIEFPMSVRVVYANPLVNENSGKVAFTYGPLVLCSESIDNQFNLSAVTVDGKQNAEVKISDNSQYVLSVSIPVNYFVPSDKLYSFDEPRTEKKVLKLIPYFAWNNRGVGDMKVWFSVNFQ